MRRCELRDVYKVGKCGISDINETNDSTASEDELNFASTKYVNNK